MNYSDIQKVNSEITMLPIQKKDKNGKLTAKDYAMVPERITAFRKLFPTGFITTEIVSHDGQTVLMQTKAGYYDEKGLPIILATGFAQEVKGLGLVNGTSYIENCETSSVGRALGMIGLGINGGGICSAEELANAITAQNQIKENAQKPAQKNEAPKTEAPKAQVETAKTLPENPVANYIRNEICDIQGLLEIKTYDEARKTVFSYADALVTGRVVPAFDWKTITMDEAKKLFSEIRVYLPKGDEK